METKKTIVAFCILLTLTTTLGFSQTKSEIFDKNVPITWLGLDFTSAKFIGDREKYGSSSDVKFLIKSWNDLMEREKDKYSVARGTRRRSVEYHTEVAREHNEVLDISEMLTNNKDEHLRLKEEDIATIVKTYDFPGLNGIGLMFNVESFNKFRQESAIWVTFINLSTKEVMLTNRILAHPGGAGMRNYWARSVLETLERMEKQMEVWRKKNAK